MHGLREYIRLLIETEKEVLGEPDMSAEDEREEDDESHHDEQSVSSNIAGYTLPLGMGSKDDRKKRRKGAVKANASAFGGAKIYNK